MDDEELLEKAKALGAVEDLPEDDQKFVERVLGLLRQEKKVTKKERSRIDELHREHVAQAGDVDPNEDVDEDDFV